MMDERRPFDPEHTAERETRIQDRGPAGTLDAPDMSGERIARTDPSDGRVPRASRSVGEPLPHESARLHVTGEARYTDDVPEPPGTLHAYIAQSSRAHARLASIDLDAVREAPGVHAVLAASDVPGINDCSPVLGDDPIFADGEVLYVGQSVFAVMALTRDLAREAAALARIEYEDRPAAISIDEAIALGDAEGDLLPPHEMRLGDPETVLADAVHVIAGRIEAGGQDHFYLEGQIAMALPGEGDEMHVLSSTQHPSEVQHNVAKALGVPDGAVTVEVRRMGGGFGGKESQPALLACICALAARATGRAVKLRMDRDDDMVVTGKRHDLRADYRVAHDERGRVLAMEVDHALRCGCSSDLSAAIADRAMFHADNAYAFPAARIGSRRLRTHTVSNTAFRGFGGPQGMLAAERIMDRIAHRCGLDPLDVRRANFYPEQGRDPAPTPYHMPVEDCVIGAITNELERTSDYRRRRAAIDAWNDRSPVIKRGLALTPVKFGISFTTSHLNQAGALIQLYKDGSVLLNHGGTEMGQGLHVKVAQVVADALGVPASRVRVTATRTDKVPNTSATAASSGSDLNGFAAANAAATLRGRLAGVAAAEWGCEAGAIAFHDDAAHGPDGQRIGFPDLVTLAYLARVSLSATGFYATPGIGYDRETASGRPFFYFAYGAACSEVAIDTLTGEARVLRADILHDVGRSLNPAIDLGQIEGGFVQGMGWLTTEELVWDEAGRLRTHAPATYKIPTSADRPADLRIALFENENRSETIHRSKAVGEPPFMLAISVHCAISDAVRAAGHGALFPDLDAPATPERILRAVMGVRGESMPDKVAGTSAVRPVGDVGKGDPYAPAPGGSGSA